MKGWGLRTRAAIFWGSGFVILGLAFLIILAALIRARIQESPEETTALIVNELGLEIDTVDELTVTDPSGDAVTGGEITPLLQEVANETREDIARWTLTAVPLLAIAGGFAGWWLAGRAVVPVTAMTAKARRVSSDHLDTRIDLEGPDDEVKELADAFDSMMGRLEHAFEAQGRFAASASHELRTPLTLIRTELDVALGQPDPSPKELAEMGGAIRDAIARSEKVIDSLLMLARSGIVETVSPVELGSVLDRVLDDLSSQIEAKGITVVKSSFERSLVRGDEVLIERLVRNLLTNAVVHNVAGGRLEVGLSRTDGDLVLRLDNTGPALEMESLDRLTEPFYRGEGGNRVPGSGLGLTIATSIAEAHGAQLHLGPRPGGGMTVAVSFRQAPDHDIQELENAFPRVS